MSATLLEERRRLDQGSDIGGRRVQRRIGLPSTRAIVGGLLVAIAGIGTFYAAVGATADDRVAVAVAAHDLEPGHVLTPTDLRLVEVALPGDVRGLFGSVDAAAGRRLVGALGAGEFLLASATVVPTDGDEHLEVALTTSRTRIVDGLTTGDRVDVFSTWDADVTELIAVDARVLAVSAASIGLGGDTVTVRLALSDFSQVEALVHAQAAGDITVIRAAIGTETGDVGREYRPHSDGGG